MTEHLLTPPPVIGENQSGDRAPHSSCLQACIASVCTWNGRTTVAREVDDFIAATFVGWNPNDGCTVEMGKAWFDHIGMGCEIDDGNVPLDTYVRPAIDAGDIVIAEHQCDGFAIPVPVGTANIRHFRVIWGFDDVAVATMNPWPPSQESNPWPAMYAADTKQHIRVFATVSDDLIRAFCRMGNWIEGASEPSEADLESWVNNAKSQGQGLDAILALSRDSQKGQEYWQGIQAAISLARQFSVFQADLNSHLQRLDAASTNPSVSATVTVDPSQLQPVVQAAVKEELAKVIAALQGVQS